MELKPFLHYMSKEQLQKAVEPYYVASKCPPFMEYEGEYICKYSHELPDWFHEFLLPHPFLLGLYVSNYGRIYKKNPFLGNDFLVFLPYREHPTMKGYFYVYDGQYCYFVYNLVAETFLLPFNPDPSDYSIVHHITNNGFVNTPFNLIYVTHPQHSYIHKHLPDGWENMTEEEAMKEQNESLKKWRSKVQDTLPMRPWQEICELKASYLKTRGPVTPLTEDQYRKLYSMPFTPTLFKKVED